MFILDVIKAFHQRKVKYAVSGGYAVALHGAVRGTVDLDLVLALSLQNYEAAERALLSIGFQSKLPITAKDVFSFRKEYIEKKNLIAWSFYDPKDPSKIVDIIITFNKKVIPKETFILQGEKIAVLSKKALIEMKKKAGRPQDLEDIQALGYLK